MNDNVDPADVMWAIFMQGQINRLHKGLIRLRWSKSMREIADSMEAVSAAWRDALTPALEELTFYTQAFAVTLLNSEPWYRHLRMRWSLRKARRWSTT